MANYTFFISFVLLKTEIETSKFVRIVKESSSFCIGAI